MSTLNYNDFTYITNNPNDFINGMDIKFNEAIPTHLYKYYSQQPRNLEAVYKGQLYFSHPYHFNDITDSTVHSFDFSGLTFDKYQRLNKKLFNKTDLKEMYRQDKKSGFQQFRLFFYSLLTQKIGICCLTSKEMDNLMWGHYATDSGFKIKFDKNTLISSLNKKNEKECKLFPINYVPQKLQVNVQKYGGIGIPLLLDLSTKVESWRYEKEWRLVMTKDDMCIPNSIKTPNLKNHIGKQDRFFKYEEASISEVVLGMNFLMEITLNHQNTFLKMYES